MYKHLSDVKEIKTKEKKTKKSRDIQLRVIRFINLRKKENGLSGTWFDFVKKVEIEIKNYEKYL